MQHLTCPFVCRRRSQCGLLLAVLLLGSVALYPTPALGACGISDPGACADAALYDFYLWLAGYGWAVDSTLLLLAYQLDSLRWWLTTTVFGSAFRVVTALVNPLIVPIATVAILIGLLSILLTPILGNPRLVNIRQALTWTVLAPLLLTMSGPLIVQLEEARSAMGAAIFSAAATIAPESVFGAPGGDMPAPQQIYPANPCGGAGLPRYFPGDVPRTDELAAALLWADTEDIHCPTREGPGRDIPDRFYEAEPNGPGYATDMDIGSLDPEPRREALAAIKRGVTRLYLGVLPSMLAVFDALANLIFALSLLVVWISLPLGLLFVFWQDTAAGVTGLFRQLVSVLRVSWVSSFLLGLISSCLIAAANLKNGTAYAGFAVGGLLVTLYVLFAATDTFKDCLGALNTSVRTLTGVSLGRPVEAAGGIATGAAGLGLAAATGGAATAFMAAAALRQTGSGQVALGTMLGQFRPVMQAGEIARLMDSGNPELLDGIRAGHAGTRSLRNLGMALETAGRHAEARRRSSGKATPQHTPAGQDRQTLASSSRDGATVPTSASAPQDDDQAVLDGAVFQAISRRADLVSVHMRARVEALALAPRAPAVADPLLLPAPRAGSEPNDDATVAQTAPNIDYRYSIYRLGPEGQVQVQARNPDGALPSHALTLPSADVALSRLMQLGYAVQRNLDGTTSFWQQTPPDAPPDTASQAQERLDLIMRGAIAGDVKAAEAALHAAQAQQAQARQGQPAAPARLPAPRTLPTPIAATPSAKAQIPARPVEQSPEAVSAEPTVPTSATRTERAREVVDTIAEAQQHRDALRQDNPVEDENA